MKRIPKWAFAVSLFFSLLGMTSCSPDPEVTTALFNFFRRLSENSTLSKPISGWNNSSSDPCAWSHVSCDGGNVKVQKITLEEYNLSGTFSPSILCTVPPLVASLTEISLSGNHLNGDNLEMIVNCKELLHVNISGNQFSGNLPDSFAYLNNLVSLDISDNHFLGPLPDKLPRISCLQYFLAQNNMLSGPIPDLDFSNLISFDVSNNSFSGPVPAGGDSFSVSSYLGNPQLCGSPLPNKCQAQRAESSKKRHISELDILMYAGYVVISVTLFLLVVIKLCRMKKKRSETESVLGTYKPEKCKVLSSDHDDNSISIISKPSNTFVSNEFKTTYNASKSEVYSAGEADSVDQSISAPVSSSLIVLTSPEVNGLKFEDLLKAPAELLGRGMHGSVYKVKCEDQKMTLAVKRIKDWAMTCADFKARMRRLDRVKHPNVLPAIAFYCSRQEKLLVYEYQPNGSLSRLVQGIQVGQILDWSSRLGVASVIAEALAFMHEELREDGIAHGNLKSSNILFTKNMELRVSEYGLMPNSNSFLSPYPGQAEASFEGDVYALGVILLELLTGKMPVVQNNGMDLATWVVSVVREEWTVEVFDRSLIREGASEDRMVSLLQVAIKCVNREPGARPSMSQVAVMINAIKEEDERSMDLSEPPSTHGY